MVAFNNAAGSNGLSDWYSPNGEPQRIAFGRGRSLGDLYVALTLT